MVSANPIKVEIKSDRDAMAAIEAVEEDGVPREIQRGGKVVATITPASTSGRREWKPSKEDIEAAKATAGSWKKYPELSDLAERIHKWREESPPSDPVNW